MSRLEGSIAAASFADALAVVRATPLHPARRRPAIDVIGPPLGTPAAGPSGTGVGRGPLVEAAAAVAAGRTTSRELVERSLEAIDRHDAALVGMAAHDPEAALAEADRRDAERRSGGPLGVLHGVPITVKDVIDVAGLPTRAGSSTYDDLPARDATGVARLRAAGAVVLGKAATHEFALGVTSPQCRNPHDPSRLAGGSSGGSAVAVATGMGLGSLGTDTRASIRVPAAMCGLVGLKPTYGRVPTDGVVTLSWTMDHVAPMAATVADAAAMLDALVPSGQRWLDHAAAVDPTTLRIGVVPTAFAEADPAVASVVEGAVRAMAKAGCVVLDSARPDDADLDLANAAGLVVSRCEASTQHLSLDLDRSQYWEEVADQLDAAGEIRAVDYLQAQRLRHQLTEAMLGQFTDHDLLAMPTLPVVAPPAEDFAQYLMRLARNAIPWSFVGFPAITVPCGTVDGLPVGLQLVAPPGREDLLVAAGAMVEVLPSA